MTELSSETIHASCVAINGAAVLIADRSAAWLIDAYDAAVGDLPPLAEVPHT